MAFTRLRPLEQSIRKFVLYRLNIFIWKTDYLLKYGSGMFRKLTEKSYQLGNVGKPFPQEQMPFSSFFFLNLSPSTAERRAHSSRANDPGLVLLTAIRCQPVKKVVLYIVCPSCCREYYTT